MSSLDVHFHGERIGTLFLAGEDDYRLAYDPRAVERAGPGAMLLSAALPARPEPFGAEATRAYIEGLLPEGRRRELIAAELGVDPNDGWGLIAEIGRDCPGAVSFIPKGMEVAGEGGHGDGAWLSEEELEALVAPPRRQRSTAAPPPVRASLGGERHKLALVRDEEGDRWGLPGPDRPSTHIVKPESGEYPGLAANEMFCTALARHACLAAADAEYAVIGGRPCTVSRRFDRARTGKGVSRLHQEDFCQALGFAPPRDVAAGRAPERDAEGPRFAEACGLLTALNGGSHLLALLGATVLNYALGNGDAHGKNFAVLYGGARPTLAPLYDLTSTAVYDLPTHTGMVLSSDYDETAYLVEMERVGRECGVELDRFRALIADTAAKIENSLELVAEQAWEEGWHDPIVDDIIELATERARGLGYEVEY